MAAIADHYAGIAASTAISRIEVCPARAKQHEKEGGTMITKNYSKTRKVEGISYLDLLTI
jgi:hypothetical protein